MNQTNNHNNTNDEQPHVCTPQISQNSKTKAELFRAYIEKKYSKKKLEDKEKKENWELFQKKMDDLNISLPEQEHIKREILQKEAQQMRKKRKRISAKDFEPLTIIGRGAFGEVRICKWKDTNEIVAMKKINKSEMLNKNQISHIRAERDVLATAQNPWIVELKCSFQDDKYLYLVMDYLAGGDLMTLLMKKDILSEYESKFYIAEAILAVESVHKLNYIHRDLKPDNILMDSKGHLKLSDFGLCKHTEIRPRRFQYKKNDEPEPDPILTKSNLANKPNGFKRNRQLAFSTVGTPDYIAPEVFGDKGYTETVDWWSLGVILFEMLIGYPPFYADDPAKTCQNILNWKKTLIIPPESNISPQAVDILRKLIADSHERLGINGVEEIKAHPFFAGIDWKRIREQKAPNIPELKSEIDTSNFEKFEEEEPWYTEDTMKPRKFRKDANFIGYTFKRDIEAQRSLLVSALQELEASKASQTRPKTSQGTQNIKNNESNPRGLSPNCPQRISNPNIMINTSLKPDLSFLGSKYDNGRYDRTQIGPSRGHQESSSKSPSNANPLKKGIIYKENIVKVFGPNAQNPRADTTNVYTNLNDTTTISSRKKENQAGMMMYHNPELNCTKTTMPKYMPTTSATGIGMGNNQPSARQPNPMTQKILNPNPNYNNLNKNQGISEYSGPINSTNTTTTTYGIFNTKYSGINPGPSIMTLNKPAHKLNKD